MTLTHPFIDPVAFQLGPLALHWYGLMYVIGFVAFWWLGSRRAARQPFAPIEPAQVGDLLFWGALGVIVGGRVGYTLFYGFDNFLAAPWTLLYLWQGGMSFHGGLIGVLLAAGWYARRHEIDYVRLMDFVAPLIPIGLGTGRIGNWINGELWGKPTDVPWGMIFPHVDGLARHPSQLYQAALEGAVLFAILYWVSARPTRRGLISGLFLSLYGLFRFTVEFVREPDAHIGYLAFGWLTMGQLLSLPLIILGLGFIVWSRRQPQPEARESRSTNDAA
ncbi:MAG: prolipoprotein diacylglyceryl transferase [Thioalkalivibrionaceae bacterium]